MLSEYELLLLANFMYADISASQNDESLAVIMLARSVNGVVTADKLADVKVTGGINKEQMADIMNMMIKSDAIMNLTMHNSIDDGIRGTCFLNKSTGEAAIAFRGTGGEYPQWKSNTDAFSEVTVKEQEQAVDFVRQFDFDYIVVTGHSKGSNLAKTATLMLGNSISRCVVFEGQGYSTPFVTTYAAQIAEHGKKIVSISSNRDPIHALMHSVDGSQIHIETTKGLFSHSSYALLANAKFNMYGNIAENSKTAPAPHIVALNKWSIKLSDYAANTPGSGDLLNYHVRQLGLAVALGFELSGDKSDMEKIKTFKRYLDDRNTNKRQREAAWVRDIKANELEKEFAKFNDYILRNHGISKGYFDNKKPRVSYAYIVRGARLGCVRGSHSTFIDMPVCHGSYIREKPMMNQDDCVVGLDNNIAPFGACNSPHNPNQEIVIHDMVDRMPIRNNKGKLVEATSAVEGRLCTPMLGPKWWDAYEDTLIDGVPAITTASTLTCAYDGVIFFLDSGQGV